MKRRLMETYLGASAFRYERDAHAHGDPENDRETCDVFVDADVQPAERDVGIPFPSADVTEVLTRAGEDITELLTTAALEELGERFLAWRDECAEDAYWADVNWRIKEAKEERA